MRLALTLGLLFILTITGSAATNIKIDATKQIGSIGNLYNIGYNGWGDITNKGMVGAFNDLKIKYCRIDVNLNELCGDKPGDYHWDYMTRADMEIGLVDRIRKIISNGWTPIIAFSYHGGVQQWMPRWFHGEANDSKKDGWTRYNLDGIKVTTGYGNQLESATQIARDLVNHFISRGLKGLYWETIYEMNPDMPLVEIHYAVGKGIKEADPSAKIIGPATWPGWSVEEQFVKPYLKKYGADLLDMVSAHWYGCNDHGFWKLMEGDDCLTMADTKQLAYLMGKTPEYKKWTRTLNSMLSNTTLNPTRKKIGIIYTEIDVNPTSYYLKNPINKDWPKYRADTDCFLNCNYYGGVWWASVLCNITSAGATADACKFNGRNYYGIQELAPNDIAYRYPVWFAFKLLRDQGQLISGKHMLSTSAKGAPMLEAFATGSSSDLRVIIINKSSAPQTADLSISGLKPGKWTATSYLFDKTRVAQFRGKQPGTESDGTFEGDPDNDSISTKCLSPIGSIKCKSIKGSILLNRQQYPPVSFTVLVFSNKE